MVRLRAWARYGKNHFLEYRKHILFSCLGYHYCNPEIARIVIKLLMVKYYFIPAFVTINKFKKNNWYYAINRRKTDYLFYVNEAARLMWTGFAELPRPVHSGL